MARLEAPALKTLLVAGCLVLLLAGGCFSPSHPAVGKWQGGLLTIAIYRDGKASINGVQCRWQAADPLVARLELREPIVIDVIKIPLSFDFRVLDRSQGRKAVVNLVGLDVELARQLQ